MRDIKFRCWNPQDGPGYSSDQEGCMEDGIPSIDDYGIVDDIIDTRREEGYVIMQYTGLKDKNGVEIYEGDIMDGYAGRQQVIWSEDVGIGFGFCWEPIEKNTESITGFIDEYEVIGNIYENPELINSPETL